MTTPRLSPAMVAEMRAWIADCSWRDEPDVDALSDADVIAGVQRHYDGGIEQFRRDSAPDYDYDARPVPGVRPGTTEYTGIMLGERRDV